MGHPIRAAFAATALAALALTGCANEPPAEPRHYKYNGPLVSKSDAPFSAIETQAATAPGRVDVANLPTAPPVGTWVRKGSDFQQTLDLRMQTALIKLGIPYADVTESVARDHAYFVCSHLRSGATNAGDPLRRLYPTASASTGIVGVAIEAQTYCLDTV